MTAFELWEARSHNLMADFDTEAEALSAIAEAIYRYGPGYADSIVLIRVGPRGGLKRVAAGVDLAERALSTVNTPRSVSA
jgi:hypothetical protein